MNKLAKCAVCHKYTLSNNCCDSPTINPRPPKYSPEDKYGKYRRAAKEENNDVDIQKNRENTQT